MDREGLERARSRFRRDATTTTTTTTTMTMTMTMTVMCLLVFSLRGVVFVVVVYVCTDERVFERAPDSDASAMSDVERLALSVDASIRHRSSSTTVSGATTTGMDERMIRRQVRIYGCVCV